MQVRATVSRAILCFKAKFGRVLCIRKLSFAVSSLALEPLSSKTTRTGSSVTLSCALARGDKNVDFSWTRNGLLIQESLRLEILKRKRTSALIIDSVEVSDAGRYTCIASDGLSEDRSAAELIVEGELEFDTIGFATIREALQLLNFGNFA